MRNYIIAIDGGAATGKSTIAKALASKLNILYIDTGAMFRAFALYFIQNNIEINEQNIIENIDDIHINLKYENGSVVTILNSEDVSNYIRTEQVSITASVISKYPIVREKLLELQRNMANNNSVVIEGRDVTTVVFPNADVKLFFTTDIKERARRRQKDLMSIGEDVSTSNIEASLTKRDILDSTREVAPLKKAEDAIEIDTTSGGIENIVNYVINILKERIKE